jgi:serine phosphatase RsbU (regulator of sigma subunit)/putative methionine-R-sulfoxide reductase with GAF domain
VLTIQVARALREILQGGRSGLITWWQSSWRPMLLAEVAPLPFSALFAAIYVVLGPIYFLMSGAALLAVSIAVRRAAQNLRRQRRSVRELALLNEASRAIIRAELDANALCDLIYREASKVVDTSSFHLGLFEPESDRYTLMVRVQDRVRLPRLTVDLPLGDGIVGWMRQTGRALLVEDFADEMEHLPARPRYQSERPPRSGIYVPLLAGEAVIGSISIQSYIARTFDTDDLRLLSLIADQAAVAIAKARAYDDARQRAVQLQAIHEVSERITAILDPDELLLSVVRLIREHFEYHPVHIFTLETTDTLVFRASTAESAALAAASKGSMQLGHGLVGSAAEHGQPILVDDVRTDPRYIGDDAQTRSELAVPLRFGDQIIGVLDLQSAEVCGFRQRDLAVMQTMADQIAVAIVSARAFTAQREESWTLNALLQVAENIARTSTLDELLQTVVRLPPLLLGCDRCYCLMWDRSQATFTPRAAYGLNEHQRSAFLGWPFGAEDAPLLADVIRSLIAIAVDDAGSRHYVCPPILEPFGGQSLLALPLWSRGTALGLLVADYQEQRKGFTPREMTLYTGIANQIAGAIESALLAQEAASAARLEEELRVAREVQTALLPKAVPQIAGWDSAADWRSARIVGGDFYDYWWLPIPTEQVVAPPSIAAAAASLQRAVPMPPEQNEPIEPPNPQLGFVIADVSDKGVPAAMFMALSRSLVRAAALDGSSPSQALVRANRWIARDSESGMFVTIFYGVVEPISGRLIYCCAGHNPPLLFCYDGSVKELSTPGIALGVLEEIQLGQAEVEFHAGDLLVCYTDGVTEAFDDANEQFGVPRLIEVVQRHRNEPATAIVEAINTAMYAFTNGVIYDDVTLMVIKRDSV